MFTRLRLGKSIKISGVLYLYKITNTRLSRPLAVQLKVFQTLCGNKLYGHVLLVMTMSERLNPEVRKTRKEELILHSGYGSSVVQHLGTKESAWDIVKQLLIHKSPWYDFLESRTRHVYSLPRLLLINIQKVFRPAPGL